MTNCIEDKIEIYPIEKCKNKNDLLNDVDLIKNILNLVKKDIEKDLYNPPQKKDLEDWLEPKYMYVCFSHSKIHGVFFNCFKIHTRELLLYAKDNLEIFFKRYFLIYKYDETLKDFICIKQ